MADDGMVTVDRTRIDGATNAIEPPLPSESVSMIGNGKKQITAIASNMADSMTKFFNEDVTAKAGSKPVDISKILAERYTPTEVTGKLRIALFACIGLVMVILMANVVYTIIAKDSEMTRTAITKLSRDFGSRHIPDERVKAYAVGTLPSALLPIISVSTLAFIMPFVIELLLAGTEKVNPATYITHAKMSRGKFYIMLSGFVVVVIANMALYISRMRLIRPFASNVTVDTLRNLNILRTGVTCITTIVAMSLVMLTCLSVITSRM